jgi:hypothetical protein
VVGADLSGDLLGAEVAVTSAARDYWEGKGLRRLWFAVLSAPVAWALDQLISYALIKPVCVADATFALTAISAAALALVITGALVGRACLTRIHDAGRLSRIDAATVGGGRRIDRSYFMALVGIAFNILVGLLIVFATIPHFVLSPCE